MKKSNTIIVTFVFIIMIVFAYITGIYSKSSIRGQLNQDDNPMVLNKPTDNNLVGARWDWEKTIVSKDEIIFPRVHDAFAITFTESGELNGTTDCNSFSSEFKKDGDNIDFGLFTSNQMYCENSQEEIFKKLLAESEKFLFDEDGKLILKSEFSSIIFVNKESDQNKKNWNLIKESAANCNIREGGQTHDRKVRVTLKNGDELEAYSPKIDSIFDIVNDAEEGCGKVRIWTE
ncbi:MAG: META domain-containing protein [Candidatus Pacebacteria bacterium]|nr:META domain-containing protein [Candidatus Paceibacterota bacterium]